MNLLPKKFFVTSGCAVSKVSDLNAFDQALKEAKIGELNLVSVSSVLPVGAKQVAAAGPADGRPSPIASWLR